MKPSLMLPIVIRPIPVMGQYGVYAGAHFQQSQKIGWDAYYTHAFQQDAPLNFMDKNTGVTQIGTSASQANAIGVQFNWYFAGQIISS